MFLLLTLISNVIAQVEMVPSDAALGNELKKLQANYKKAVENSGKQSSESELLQCNEVIEIPGTIICLSSSRNKLGEYFSRMSIYAEGAGINAAGKAISKGELVPNNSIEHLIYSQKIAGTDIKGEELMRFYEKANFDCDCVTPGSEELCLNEKEKELFEKVILPASSKYDKFVILSSPFYDVRTINHELLHARYFQDTNYRIAIDEFWTKELSEDERNSVRNVFMPYYDISDEYLVKNEFQAYALDGARRKDALGKVKVDYEKRLAIFLSKKKIYSIRL